MNTKNFKNDCVSLIFLQVFGVSYFNLGGLIEPNEPPLPAPPPRSAPEHGFDIPVVKQTHDTAIQTVID